MIIQVSKLSIYREEDIKYKTPKMIISVLFFIIKHLFLCVKQKSLRDVSFTHQTHVFIDSYLIVHIYALFVIPAYLEFISNKRIFQKIKFCIFEVLLYILCMYKSL